MRRGVSSDETNAGRARLRPSRMSAADFLGAARQELRPTELERVYGDGQATNQQILNVIYDRFNLPYYDNRLFYRTRIVRIGMQAFLNC
jgi:hypothetical protein